MKKNFIENREVIISLTSAVYYPETSDIEQNDDEEFESEDYIVEIVCIEIVNGDLSGEIFHIFVKPDVALNQLHTHPQGFKLDILKNKSSFRNVVDNLIAFIGDSKIVAYSESYERTLLNKELNSIENKGYETDRFVDVSRLAKEFLVEEPDIQGIEEVAEALDITIEGDIDDSIVFAETTFKIYDKIKRNSAIVEIPNIPNQGAGPHFEVNEAGIVDIVDRNYLDDQGNNTRSLQSLHPLLQDLSQKIKAKLSAGNAPHGRVLKRIEEYNSLICQDLDKINFALLFGLGIRLENSIQAAQKEISKLELPRFEEDTSEEISSLIRIHGAFILSTADGKLLIEAEDRFARTPEQELDLQIAINKLADRLEARTDLVSQNSTDLMKTYSEESIKNKEASRMAVFSSGTASNLSVVLTAAAIVGALPLVGGATLGLAGTLSGGILALIGVEGLKKSKAFSDTTKVVTEKINALSQTELEEFIRERSPAFRPFLMFVMQNEKILRQIAGKRTRFSWIHEILDWLEQASKKD